MYRSTALFCLFSLCASANNSTSVATNDQVSEKISTRNELMFVSNTPTVLSWNIIPQSPFFNFSLDTAENNNCVVTLTDDVLFNYSISELQTVESNSIAVRLSFVHNSSSPGKHEELSRTYIFFRPLSCYTNNMKNATAVFNPPTNSIIVDFDSDSNKRDHVQQMNNRSNYPYNGSYNNYSRGNSYPIVESYDSRANSYNSYPINDSYGSYPRGGSYNNRGNIRGNYSDYNNNNSYGGISTTYNGDDINSYKEVVTIDVDETIRQDTLQSFAMITDMLNNFKGSTTTTTAAPPKH